MEDKDKEISQIKLEHFLMRRTLERIERLHTYWIQKDIPIQDRVLWLNLQYALKNSKYRSTKELGIPPVPNEDESPRIVFRVLPPDAKEE